MYTITAVAVLGLLFAGCTTINRNPERIDSYVLPSPQHGTLAEFVASVERGSAPGQSGLLLLPENAAALQWRLALVDEAKVSIDLQHFLWDADYSGALLLERVLRAADRGVRVRFLVDDIVLNHPDLSVSALSSHPNVEIRIFNPNPARRTTTGATFRFLLELRRLNRRMHNKLFIVDSHIAIVGGRNIGDSYFGLNSDYNFRDLDVLTIGEAVGEMRYSFDLFWNSLYAHPGEHLHPQGSLVEMDRVRGELSQTVSNGSTATLAITNPESWSTLLQVARGSVVHADARFVFDHPCERQNRSVATSLNALIGPDAADVTIVTPYFLPDVDMLETLAGLQNHGVVVRLLVPSLGSINHTIVHGHYGKYRDQVIESGIEVFEYRHDPRGTARSFADTGTVTAGFISMHMKAVVSGNDHVFIGSLNFDPRAMHINTENGLIVQSVEFAGAVRELLEPMMSDTESWRVTRDQNGTVWNSGEERVTRPPARSRFQRFSNFFSGLLPIGNHL